MEFNPMPSNLKNAMAMIQYAIASNWPQCGITLVPQWPKGNIAYESPAFGLNKAIMGSL